MRGGQIGKAKGARTRARSHDGQRDKKGNRGGHSDQIEEVRPGEHCLKSGGESSGEVENRFGAR